MEEVPETAAQNSRKTTLPQFSPLRSRLDYYAEKALHEILSIVSPRSHTSVRPAGKNLSAAKNGYCCPAKSSSFHHAWRGKKDEAARAALASHGLPDVDVVLTVARILPDCLRRQGINTGITGTLTFDNPS